MLPGASSLHSNSKHMFCLPSGAGGFQAVCSLCLLGRSTPLYVPLLENQVIEAKARFRLRMRYREVMGVMPDLSIWPLKCSTLSAITHLCCQCLLVPLTPTPSTSLLLPWPPSCVLSLSGTPPPHDLCAGSSSARMLFLQKLSGFPLTSSVPILVRPIALFKTAR